MCTPCSRMDLHADYGQFRRSRPRRDQLNRPRIHRQRACHIPILASLTMSNKEDTLIEDAEVSLKNGSIIHVARFCFLCDYI